MSCRYISESVLYHHGEQSLNQTIVSMAQDFVGSNNVNFLVPNGQFGTRLMGGKDSASPRYIYTYLHPITKYIFKEEDTSLLPPQQEEGVQIEPLFYLPILPTVLVNGAVGIGTGWSTNVCNHNPIEVADRLIAQLQGKTVEQPLYPWYRGFVGHIVVKEKGYQVCGNASWIDDHTFVITELPVSHWTQDYKRFLCDLVEQGDLITNFRENHTDTEVMFTITVKDERVEELKDREKLMKEFKLAGTLTTTNFILFNSRGHIHHYRDAEEIMDEFVEFRLPFYQQRRESLLNQLQKRRVMLQNKSRFVQSVIDGILTLRNKPIKVVMDEMEKMGFMKYGKDGEDPTFDYLLNIPLSGLTEERKAQLEAEKKEAERKEAVLKEKESKDLWIEDLEEFKANFLQMETKRLSELVQNQKKDGMHEAFTVDHYFKSQVRSE